MPGPHTIQSIPAELGASSSFSAVCCNSSPTFLIESHIVKTASCQICALIVNTQSPHHFPSRPVLMWRCEHFIIIQQWLRLIWCVHPDKDDLSAFRERRNSSRIKRWAARMDLHPLVSWPQNVSKRQCFREAKAVSVPFHTDSEMFLPFHWMYVRVDIAVYGVDTVPLQIYGTIFTKSLHIVCSIFALPVHENILLSYPRKVNTIFTKNGTVHMSSDVQWILIRLQF